MRVSRTIAAAALILAACDRNPVAPPVATPSAPLTVLTSGLSASLTQSDERTPFQRSLIKAIAERAAQGQPVPAQATYEYSEVTPMGIARATGEAPTIVARTILKFDNAEQAGLTQWPALVVSGAVPAGARGYVKAGDYTASVKDQIAQQYPDAWTSVSFETGPRTYTFAETLKVATTAQPAMDVQLQSLDAVTSSDRLLLGFTVLGPDLDYSIAYGLDICVFWFFGCVAEVELVDFWAGFQLDWTIATRLPMAMSVTAPAAVTEGTTVPLTSVATGEDWSAADYAAAGVSPEDGNEFVLRFIFRTGVFLEVFGADVVDLGIDVNLDRAASFATPLGSGQMLALPQFDVSVWGFDVAVAAADVGIALTPLVGSDRYTADWLVSGEGGGSGSATYANSGQGVQLGTMSALDGPGQMNVNLSGFRYYFNQFGLDLGLSFYLSVLGYGSTWTIPITQFDLGGITGGLYVGPHSGTPGELGLPIPIANVPPTVVLARSGTVPVQGQPTWIAAAGQELHFTGVASDPGRDDLTLTWNWNDGSTVPGTTYPVPHEVSETRTHQFASACLYAVGLRAVDDDQAFGEDRVPVVVTGGGQRGARLDGYWQHQLGRQGNTDFSDAELACYLSVVAHMSAVFGEEVDVASLPQAYHVLFMGQNGGDVRAHLDRQLLVAWLNFAAGAVGYDELVDLEGDGVGDTPFGQAMATVERARLNPATTERALRAFATVAHQFNVAAVSHGSR